MDIRQQFRVTMFDVDMAFIYFGAYIQWMDRGFQLYVKECGKTYSALLEEGYIIPVVESHISYYQPARLDDDVEVFTSIAEYGRSSITVLHRFCRMSDHGLLAEGRVKQVYTNSKLMKSHPLPDWILKFKAD